MLSRLAVKVICDHVSGKSKGYGFVQFTSEDDAHIALKEMDGQVNLECHGLLCLHYNTKMLLPYLLMLCFMLPFSHWMVEIFG